MGTRHLICVVLDGEYKVAQYGQWDGFPEGQGLKIVSFIEETNLDKFKEKLKKVRFLDYEGRDKEFLEKYNDAAPGWSSDPDNRTDDQKKWFESFMSRDLGAEVLENIYKSEDEEILLRNSLDFAQDSLFCEWAYVLDLDEGKLEVYEGFNDEELSENERFYGEGKGEYKPVRFVTSFSFSEILKDGFYLPHEVYKFIEGEEDDDKDCENCPNRDCCHE